MLKFLLSVLFIQLCVSEFTLTFTRISTKELNGIFIDPELSVGLIFKSTRDSLSLVNLKGEPLVEYTALVPDSAIREEYSLSILGSFYPANRTDLSEEDLENYIESEAKYLPNLYYAMEALGIEGPDMPSAMGVYVIALGFHTHQSKHSKEQKRQLPGCKCDCPKASTLACDGTSPNNLGPPQCCDCLGQCGACGSCWTSVCSTCCWQHGCCGHDICCYSGSSAACLFPVNLKCNGQYTCSGFNTNCCGQPPRGHADRCPTSSFTNGCHCDSPNKCCKEPNHKWICT